MTASRRWGYPSQFSHTVDTLAVPVCLSQESVAVIDMPLPNDDAAVSLLGEAGNAGTAGSADPAGVLAAPQPTLQCGVCGKIMSRMDALRRHVKIHIGEKPHVCSHCGWSFLQKVCSPPFTPP